VAYRLPSMNSLRVFEAVARLLSFKVAAEALHITPSAVSHAVQSLESWLGVELFARTSRRLTLTTAGRAFYPHVKEALDRLVQATESIPGRAPKGQLLISCSPTFASRWLLPKLSQFREICPDLSIEIEASQRLVEFPVDGFDLAIRRGAGHWPHLHCVRLWDETIVPVASPALLARQGPFHTVDDLERVPLLHAVSMPEDWKEWFSATNHRPPIVDGGIRFDTSSLALDAAARGLGVAIGRRPLIDDDLNEGRLVTLFGPGVKCGSAYWLVCSEEAKAWPEVLSFRKWILAASGTEPATARSAAQ